MMFGDVLDTNEVRTTNKTTTIDFIEGVFLSANPKTDF